MTNELQAMSDWLRVNLLGETIEWDEHASNNMGLCLRCKQFEEQWADSTCRPPLPLLSAPERYWRVIEAMREKGWESAMTQYTDNAIAQFHWSEGSGWFEDYLGGDTIGEAVVRAAFATLGGE